MNKKNNQRRRESVRRIESVFLELLQTRELKEITVSDICKRCGLNRSTFYANFTDIYDLADKARVRLEEEVDLLYEADRLQKLNSHDYLRLFRHMRDNQLLYRMYFKLGYDRQLQCHDYDIHEASRYFGDRHIAYHLEFFRSGFNAIVKLWLAGGCRETPEEMAKILDSEYQGRG